MPAEFPLLIPDAEDSALTLEITLESLLEDLSDREKTVLQRRFGFDGPEATLQEVAGDFGVTRERIRQIEASSKRKLRYPKAIQRLRFYIEQEGIILRLFGDRKVITDDQLSSCVRQLSPTDRLSIEIAYESTSSFLDEESVATEAGWVREEEFSLGAAELDIGGGTLRSRILEHLEAASLPIRLSDIQAAFPDYDPADVKQEMATSFGAEFEDDQLACAPRLPMRTRYTLILRDARRALHTSEIRSKNFRLFGKDESVQQIGSLLGGLEEALIVARGTYNLYENLCLNEDDLLAIRNITFEWLAEQGQFTSAKVIFPELFKGATERFGADFDYYMLLGILQDDPRFDVRRGLMVGLPDFSVRQGFKGLREEVLDVLEEAGRSLSIEQIAEALEGRRDVFPTSISVSLDASEEAVSTSRGHYDLVSRVIGDTEAQKRLLRCCLLAVAERPRSALSVAEAIAAVWGNTHVRPLKNFLSKHHVIFDVERGTISARSVPADIAHYRRTIAELRAEQAASLKDREQLSQALTLRGAPDFSADDPTLDAVTRTPNAPRDELLEKLLGDFGV